MNTRILLCVWLTIAWTVSNLNAGEPVVTQPIELGLMPRLIHVVEDYETEIEKKWWLRGEPELENLPPSLSKDLPNRRACRATETLDFDRKMGDQSITYKAVIFNPVPGPPMGDNTRLSFRYWLKGTDTLRVQIYSLTNNYHRHLLLKGLPQEKWQTATVDMTEARRPDGSGGPLSKDERIDDIQFYIDKDAELIIDDIVLYDAAVEGESREFPSRPIFTGWFDTGKQGEEWPGEFDIVLHDSPLTWDFAKGVACDGGIHVLVSMRGPRPLAKKTAVRFRYLLTEADTLTVELLSKDGRQTQAVERPQTSEWAETTILFTRESIGVADHIRFVVPKGSLRIDDVLVYEP